MQENVIRSPTRPLSGTGLVPTRPLPVLFTSLIGREQHITSACALLQRPNVRLLTFVGTGGVGKTRLALQVAQRMRESLFDGISFIGLAAVSDPLLMMPMIAQELGIKEMGGLSLFEQVTVSLRERQFLLLLDNFEQLLTAAPALEDLLRACPLLKLLVTSRAVLHLQAEHVFPVSPLALPDLTQLSDSEALCSHAAVALFVERRLFP